MLHSIGQKRAKDVGHGGRVVFGEVRLALR
jgi:hypothetical protein